MKIMKTDEYNDYWSTVADEMDYCGGWDTKPTRYDINDKLNNKLCNLTFFNKKGELISEIKKIIICNDLDIYSDNFITELFNKKIDTVDIFDDYTDTILFYIDIPSEYKKLKNNKKNNE